MALPFAREIAGDWRGAAALWAELGCPYEQALALAQGDREALLTSLTLLEQLGARPAVGMVRQRLEQLNLKVRFPAGLSEREIEVLRLVAQGKSNRGIAQALSISERTVAHHLSRIFAKLRVDNRAAATAFAIRHHLAGDILSSVEH
jgi:DNA-binding NarL/FixJ family response regulator